jgi:hypothetical protein
MVPIRDPFHPTGNGTPLKKEKIERFGWIAKDTLKSIDLGQRKLSF